MPLEIVRNDITKMNVDAIVNASNPALKMGGGVSGAIFDAAGAGQLQAACDRIGGCEVGRAVVTDGFALPARYVIHTAGPVWRGGNYGESDLLQECYKNSLLLALKYGCSSVAVPLISSGVYGYPKEEALQIAVRAIGDFLFENDMTVFLVVYDRKSFALGGKLFSGIRRFIDDHYVDTHTRTRRSDEYRYVLSENVEYIQMPQDDMYEFRALSFPKPSEKKRRLEDIVFSVEESFSEMVLRLIDQKGFTDTETYKRANLDRKLFSKIRSSRDYRPSRGTAIALAVALRLNLDETRDLIGKAGFTLTHSSKSDLIVEYFINQQNYDIHELNEALFYFCRRTLGA